MSCCDKMADQRFLLRLGGPGRVIFAEADVEESFSGEHVDGEAPMPQSDAEAELCLPLEINLVFVDGNFNDAFERSVGNESRIHQTDQCFFNRKLLQMAAIQFDDDGYFFSAANGNAKLRIFEFAEGF